MRKIINRKVYDTEKAELIDFDSNGFPCTDFKYYCESLYKTSKGNFFLFKEGGASSVMSQPVSGGRGGSEEIEVMEVDEVEEWLLRNNKIESLELHFPGALEDA